MINWIGKQNVPEWKKALAQYVEKGEDDSDE